jgi:adenylyltransferase/sulfurtransferase
LFPTPAPPETVTNCSDGGVLGMIPGLIGTLQALEIAKLILQVPEEFTLSKRMIFFDGLAMKFRNVKLRPRNPKCEVCGDNPTITDVS